MKTSTAPSADSFPKTFSVYQLRVVWLIFLFLVYGFQCQAQWSTNSTINNPVSIATGSQIAAKSIYDNAGGVIVTWTDYRSGTADIYAQRLDATGAPLWGANGVVICNATGAQTSPVLVRDGNNGAIITWEDARSGATIYAQRVNSSGLVQWTANGVLIASGSYNRRNPVITFGGSGAAFIVWEDSRAGTGANYDIYGQLINSSGVVQWTANGVAISAAVSDQVQPDVMSVGSGTSFNVTWTDYRNVGSTDIYAQRIFSNGTPAWTTDGLAVCTATGNQSQPKIVTDGNSAIGGGFISWVDTRSGGSDIYAQRINSSGVGQWLADGIAVCSASGNQTNPFMTADNTNAALVWQDSRNGNADVYAQLLDYNGVVWAANGVAVSTATGNQSNPQIVEASEGYFIAWNDERTGFDIYGQRMNDSGVPQWTANGVVIADASSSQEIQSVIPDFFGGGYSSAIVSFIDFRSGNPDVYAQRVNRDGILCGTLGSHGAMSGNATILAGLPAAYSITPLVGATTYTWVLPNGWTGSSTTNSITVTPNGTSGSLSVQASNTCGLSSGTASSFLAITVSKQNQTITFTSLAAKSFGDANFNLAATASSTLPVSYTSSNTNVATISGSAVTIVGVGTTTISASQSGNDIFNAAPNVLQDLIVNKGNQSITFTALPAKAVGDAPFALSATASSGLAVSYTSSNTSIATVSGNTVTLVAPGSVTIHANQAGNANYNAATQVSQTFCVNPAKPTITASQVNTESPTLTSSSAAGNQWFLNDAAISGATNATLAVAAAGIYKVQVTTGGCTSAFSDNFTFVITGDNSFTSSKSQFSIYPNPTFDRLTVSLPNDYQNKEISIYTINGQRVDFNETYGEEVQFDVAGYSPGVYLIKMSSARTNGIIRFTKQ